MIVKDIEDNVNIRFI